MIGRKIILLFALGVTAALFTGCSGSDSQTKSISSDEAKTLALADAGIQANAVEHTASTLSSRNGLNYYAVSFTADGMEYQYDIDAVTGTVIESRTSAVQPAQPAQPTQPEQPEQPGQRTSAAAEGHTALPALDARDTAKSRETTSAAGNTLMNQEDAKKKALDHAGFLSDQVTFSKCKLDWEDGRQVYEIEFYTGKNEEYSYDIDANTGAVISSDYEIQDDSRLPSGGANENMISADRAKEIALHEVTGAKNQDILEFKTDYDDGRLEYEGKIIFGDMKYEFEIDGYSGAIRSWEVKSIYR